MSSENVAQDTAEGIISERNVSPLDPTKGCHGLLGIREAVPVGLRRVGVLIAALSHDEPMHPCLHEDDIRQTVVAELADLEGILEAIRTEAESLAEKEGQA